MAGSQSIAQAAIADMSTTENKAINLSMIVLAATLGVTIGPLIGGYTSDPRVVSWFTLTTPFLVAAAIAAINAVLLLFFFKETFQHKVVLQRFDFFKGLHLFFAAFKDKSRIVMSSFFLCQQLAWALYFQAVSWLLLQVYHYNTVQLSWFTTYVGVAFSIALTVIVRIMMSWLRTEMRVFLVCAAVVAIANFAVAIFVEEWTQWFWAVFNASAAALCYSMGLAIFSNSVGHERQGWIMGITGSLAAVSWTFTGLAAGLTGYINIRMPYWICGILALLSFILARYYQQHYYKK
jgi:MFS family permease